MVNGGKKFLNGGENFFLILLVTCYYVTKVTTGLRLGITYLGFIYSLLVLIYYSSLILFYV